MNSSQDWLTKAFPHLSSIKPLKQGGQKLVYACESSDFGPCVLKLVLAPHRLDRELEAVRRLTDLQSENVPRIYAVDTTDSPLGPLIWLLEQRIPGIDLSERLQKGPFGKDETLRLALDLVSTAVIAESVNVVHRDIKPGNIKIDEGGKAWLLDFGIARILDLESRTSTALLRGPHSPGYSAPEQLENRKRDIDGRSDLFAIGVVLYESVSGCNPFIEGAQDVPEILRRVQQEPLPFLKLEWDPDGLFAELVSAFVQKQPHQRPLSCAHALDWLKEVVDQLGGM